jgi:CRP/FNR family transcriptional regulator
MSVLGELERFDAFQRLGSQAKALIRRSAICKNVSPMAAVLHKGQPVSGAYVVLNGRLRVFTIAPNGTEATLYFIDPGETCILALNCLFNDLLYPAWVQAEATSSVALISGPVFRTLFQTEPSIQNLTVHALSTLVYRLMGELERIHASHHKERLAQFILAHAASDGVLRMTQQQLAQHLGTTREVVARLMQGFVATGYVRTQRGQITIRDLFGLRGLVAPDWEP